MGLAMFCLGGTLQYLSKEVAVVKWESEFPITNYTASTGKHLISKNKFITVSSKDYLQWTHFNIIYN